MTRTFKTVGSAVVLLGDNLGEIGGSEYLATMHNTVAGKPPVLDLKREAALQKLIVKLIADGCVESAHDCSEGGLAVALAECTFDTGGLGVSADVTAVASERNPDFVVNATLFGESASRILVSVSSHHLDHVMAEAEAAERDGEGDWQDRRRSHSSQRQRRGRHRQSRSVRRARMGDGNRKQDAAQAESRLKAESRYVRQVQG